MIGRFHCSSTSMMDLQTCLTSVYAPAMRPFDYNIPNNLIIIDDFNARVENNDETWPNYYGHFRVSNLFSVRDFSATNSLLCTKERYKCHICIVVKTLASARPHNCQAKVPTQFQDNKNVLHCRLRHWPLSCFCKLKCDQRIFSSQTTRKTKSRHLQIPPCCQNWNFKRSLLRSVQLCWKLPINSFVGNFYNSQLRHY